MNNKKYIEPSRPRHGIPAALLCLRQNRTAFIACAISLLVLVCTPLLAGYQAGLDAYNAGDYATAMAEWKEAVRTEPEREDLALYRETLYAIAMLYWQGQGVEQDYAVSAVWLKQAADINHPGAQAKLGYLYLSGEGGARNDGEAARYLRLAARQGDADAQHNLEILEHAGQTASASAEPGLPPGSAAQAAPPAQPLPGRDAGEAWILRQDPERYTIQVIALRSPGKLRDFIASHPEWSPFAIYGQNRYGRPLWVMVQGSYADVERARAAVQAFPEGFQERDKLWIRKFGRVQRLIE